ncbi:hypothetical protein SCP_0804870 [Sparassis crispa]|uniref:Uncharacterized protein n=1 Tax=Sparassis crispa TaxID=139825 RepID=A0A401GUU9_9APHY|nr:hypothetical protein SCP_0804870 [Sparassis crispa]GBE85963.1 hypothetical protein SCP_0804870 [Sparassis crispa]
MAVYDLRLRGGSHTDAEAATLAASLAHRASVGSRLGNLTLDTGEFPEEESVEGLRAVVDVLDYTNYSAEIQRL